MKRQVRQLTFKEKVGAFLNQLEIARLEEGSLRVEPFFQVAVDDFCSCVAKVVEPCANGSPMDELTICDKVEIKAPKDEVWRVESVLFRVVELVECRLFNANSLFGISLNTITAHFQQDTDESAVYSFTQTMQRRSILNERKDERAVQGGTGSARRLIPQNLTGYGEGQNFCGNDPGIAQRFSRRLWVGRPQRQPGLAGDGS